jgi:chromosome segregation ATPase
MPDDTPSLTLNAAVDALRPLAKQFRAFQHLEEVLHAAMETERLITVWQEQRGALEAQLDQLRAALAQTETALQQTQQAYADELRQLDEARLRAKAEAQEERSALAHDVRAARRQADEDKAKVAEDLRAWRVTQAEEDAALQAQHDQRMAQRQAELGDLEAKLGAIRTAIAALYEGGPATS